jgi:hypothetical protein
MIAVKIRIEEKPATTMILLFALNQATDADDATAIEKIKYL